MKKYTPHYSLDAIKELVTQHGIDIFTSTARIGVLRLGLEEHEGVAVIMGLTRQMLYKSMTTYADHTVWQDVYHAPCPNGRTAYIKLTLRSGAVVIQFKER